MQRNFFFSDVIFCSKTDPLWRAFAKILVTYTLMSFTCTSLLLLSLLSPPQRLKVVFRVGKIRWTIWVLTQGYVDSNWGWSFLRLFACSHLTQGLSIFFWPISGTQEGEVNTSDLADPMKEARKCTKFSKMASSSLADTTFWGGFLQSFQLQMVLYWDL